MYCVKWFLKNVVRFIITLINIHINIFLPYFLVLTWSKIVVRLYQRSKFTFKSTKTYVKKKFKFLLFFLSLKKKVTFSIKAGVSLPYITLYVYHIFSVSKFPISRKLTIKKLPSIFHIFYLILWRGKNEKKFHLT